MCYEWFWIEIPRTIGGEMVKPLRPLKAIRAKCIDCVAGQYVEVRKCPVTTCSIWPYRMGKRPAQHSIEILMNPDNQEQNGEPQMGAPKGVK
jgi:hypothetical protein